MIRFAGVLILAALVTGCATTGFDEDYEVDIPLEEVPAEIIEAAKSALPGFEIDAAEIEVMKIYELSGTSGGKNYEVEVTEDGTVLEVEED